MQIKAGYIGEQTSRIENIAEGKYSKDNSYIGNNLTLGFFFYCGLNRPLPIWLMMKMFDFRFRAALPGTTSQFRGIGISTSYPLASKIASIKPYPAF